MVTSDNKPISSADPFELIRAVRLFDQTAEGWRCPHCRKSFLSFHAVQEHEPTCRGEQLELFK